MTDFNTKQKTILVIDGNSWMHRAFHALDFGLTAPDGRPTGAVFGFFNILNSTLNMIKPDAVIVAFDAGIPKFRMEALEQYKVHRPPTDPELKQQFPIVEDLLRSMSVPIVKIQGYEGDDILGTVARIASEQDIFTYVASGDRDTYQLVNDHVSVVAHGYKGDVKIMDPAAVEERYGIAPEQVIDYLGLKGDPSDNIPGIPGVGEKTAAKFLNEYGSLEEVLEAAERGEIKGKMGEKIRENKKLAEHSRVVATIDCYVPFDLDINSISYGTWDTHTMAAAFDDLRMKNSFVKLNEYVYGKGNADTSALSESLDAPSLKSSNHSVKDACAFQDALLGECEYIGIEISEGVATLFDSGLKLARVDSKTSEVFEGAETLKVLAESVKTHSFACANIKEVLRPVYDSDSSIPALVDIDELDSKASFDLSIAAYVLSPHADQFGLKSLVSEYLVGETGPLEFGQASGVDDNQVLINRAKAVRMLSAVLRDELKKEELLSVFREIEMPLSHVLLKMERTGITLDTSVLEEIDKEVRVEVEELSKTIQEDAGVEFNIDSPKQLSKVLFEDLGLTPGKKTKSGYSTDASVLESLIGEHKIATDILRYRELTKLRSTYLKALPKEVKGDGRLHTTFSQTVAATGRLSSLNPNLQNIPVRSELGRRVREAFVPSPTWKIISFDYSQIELRILAHLSSDEGLIAAFKSGEDFHAATAARLFGVETKDVDGGLRARAKAVNFGIIYGQGAHALSIQLGVPFDEAKTIIDRYYQTFPRVRGFLDETIASAKEHGYVKTAFGRIRPIPELKSKVFHVRAFGERTAMNMPMQGTAADLIKIAMINIDRRLREESFESRMLLQVHDELVFEAPIHELERLSKMVTAEMEGAGEFAVPLEVSCAVGDNWAEAK